MSYRTSNFSRFSDSFFHLLQTHALLRNPNTSYVVNHFVNFAFFKSSAYNARKKSPLLGNLSYSHNQKIRKFCDKVTNQLMLSRAIRNVIAQFSCEFSFFLLLLKIPSHKTSLSGDANVDGAALPQVSHITFHILVMFFRGISVKLNFPRSSLILVFMQITSIVVWLKIA